ncbi:MAG: VOC family protein [Planctomycetaceae bacterium]|nr:VOC family protein [Planctomycetaceae bacterium]
MSPTDAAFVRTVTVLPVADIEESVHWYRQALGFEAVYLHTGDDDSEPTNYAILRRGDVQFHLILDEPSHRLSWTKAGAGYLYLFVRDIDATFAEVNSRGVPIARGLQTENWGARGFNLTDPSGNAVHVEQVS